MVSRSSGTAKTRALVAVEGSLNTSGCVVMVSVYFFSSIRQAVFLVYLWHIGFKVGGLESGNR